MSHQYLRDPPFVLALRTNPADSPRSTGSTVPDTNCISAICPPQRFSAATPFPLWTVGLFCLPSSSHEKRQVLPILVNLCPPLALPSVIPCHCLSFLQRGQGPPCQAPTSGWPDSSDGFFEITFEVSGPICPRDLSSPLQWLADGRTLFSFSSPPETAFLSFTSVWLVTCLLQAECLSILTRLATPFWYGLFLHYDHDRWSE